MPSEKRYEQLQFLANYTCVPAIAIHISRIFKRISDLSSLMRFVTDQATHTLEGPPELRWGNSLLTRLGEGRASGTVISQAGNTGGRLAIRT
jgi:hypothetical protein